MNPLFKLSEGALQVVAVANSMEFFVSTYIATAERGADNGGTCYFRRSIGFR